MKTFPCLHNGNIWEDCSLFGADAHISLGMQDSMDTFTGNDSRSELREYLHVLRARKWSVILTTLLVVGIAGYFTVSQTPLYTAEARVLVKSLPTNPNDYYLLPPNLETEGQLASSQPVAQLVQEDLETEQSTPELLSGLNTEPVLQSEVLILRYTSAEPEFAQEAANAFARNYLDYRVDQALQSLLAAADSIEKRADGVEARLTEVGEQLETAEQLGDRSLVDSLEAERSVLLARLGVLQQRLDDVQPDRSVQMGGGDVIKQATVPASPSSPNYTTNGLLAIVLGIGLGIGLAFVRERIDDRFKGRMDVVQSIEAPVLAAVPRFKTRRADRKKGRAPLIALVDSTSSASEAYRTLRTGLQFLASENGFSSIVVTSPMAGEGKTVTSANLAIALAQAGTRVIIVSADLRRPTLERYFNVSSEKGLSTWLTDPPGTPVPLVKLSDVDNLEVLPSGTIPVNPAELLSSPKLPELVAQLRERADLVIFDSPPVLPVADASILASELGWALLVLDAENTKRSAAIHAKTELERVGGKVIGTVLNAFDPSGSAYSRYESNYYPGYQSYKPAPPTQEGTKKKGLLRGRQKVRG